MKSRVIAVLSAAAVAVSCGAAVAEARTSQPITRGNTQITLNTNTVQALHDHNFALAATPGATVRNGVLKLPTTGGTANPPNYVIEQGGGFSITRNGKRISVSHIVYNTAKHQATGAVTGHGTIVVFTVGDPNMGNGGPGMVQFGGFPVKLANGFVRILDNTYNAQVFANHPSLGTGGTTVYFG